MLAEWLQSVTKIFSGSFSSEQKPNTWRNYFVEVSKHKLESRYSNLRFPYTMFTLQTSFNPLLPHEEGSKIRLVQVTMNSKEENSFWLRLLSQLRPRIRPQERFREGKESWSNSLPYPPETCRWEPRAFPPGRCCYAAAACVPRTAAHTGPSHTKYNSHHR